MMRTLLLFWVLCCLAACQKKDLLVDVNNDYLGTWAAEGDPPCDLFIRVESDGKAEYYTGANSIDCPGKTIAKGKAKTNGEDFFLKNCRFPIAQAPEQQSKGDWQFILVIDDEQKVFTRL